MLTLLEITVIDMQILPMKIFIEKEVLGFTYFFLFRFLLLKKLHQNTCL